jgi:UDP-N-acetylglucosamine transferase subunit ALG13
LIYVTLGTDDHPFERALEALRQLDGNEELVIQHGHTPPIELGSNATWHTFVGYRENIDLMNCSCALVMHAGVGSIMSALDVGVVPVVIPRLRRYGEHVDDHQCEIAARFAKQGFVLVAEDGTALRTSVAQAHGLARLRRQHNSGALGTAVRQALRVVLADA